MRKQIRRRDTIIESLNKELEKEREHNRAKDWQLLDTLPKLAETRVAFALAECREAESNLERECNIL